jgi:hypothetical protein
VGQNKLPKWAKSSCQRQKPEAQRTPLEEQLLQSLLAFTDTLLHYERQSESRSGSEDAITSMLRGYNNIKLDHATTERDIEVIELFRKALRRD